VSVRNFFVRAQAAQSVIIELDCSFRDRKAARRLTDARAHSITAAGLFGIND